MDKKILKIRELEHWLTVEFVIRMESIRRCKYLGLDVPEREYELQLEAYEKEQEYRQLKGLKPLPKLKDLFII